MVTTLIIITTLLVVTLAAAYYWLFVQPLKDKLKHVRMLNDKLLTLVKSNQAQLEECVELMQKSAEHIKKQEELIRDANNLLEAYNNETDLLLFKLQQSGQQLPDK